MTGHRQQNASSTAEEGRLLARPGQPAEAGLPGMHSLGLDAGRDGVIYVPAGYRANQPAPLAVMLHGAGGSSDQGIMFMRPIADAMGIILLSPDSRRQTWDVIAGGYGPDVAFIDRALAQTFARYSVDPARIAVGGFSDGASYALSLGIINGDLFTHMLAYSPGFMAPTNQQGAPRIYISHGVHDAVLPIDRCSRRLVPQLKRAGYDVTYHEFDGPHTIPPEIALEGVEWFMG